MDYDELEFLFESLVVQSEEDEMPDQSSNPRGQLLSRKTTRVAVHSPSKSPTKSGGRVSHLGLTLPASLVVQSDEDEMPDQSSNPRGQLLSRKTTRVAVHSPSKSPTKIGGRVSHLGLTLPARPSRFIPAETKPFDPEEEYDYDSTDDECDTGKKSSPEPHRGAVTFERLCRKYGKNPVNGVMKQFGRGVISLEGMNLSQRELKAFFIALVAEQEEDLTRLEMTGNKLGMKETGYLTQFASVHKPLTIVNLSGCHLCSKGLRTLATYAKTNKNIKTLNLSDNNIGDRKTPMIADIIENGEKITELVLSRNRIGDSAKLLGEALAHNDSLTLLDLSWNHIRGPGAIGFCKGLKGNQSLQTLILAWNGFGFEGCVALKNVLLENTSLQTLDLSNNRVHTPALFELIKGVEKNKTLVTLKLGNNPITAQMSTILLNSIHNAPESNLKELDLAGIVVDKEFETILKQMQETRLFIVRYDLSLPLNKGEITKVDPRNIFNIDPIRILYFMKEHLRTIDLFLKVDKDGSNTLTKDEMKYAFEMEGFPISETALSSVMGYLDTNKDGEVDLLILLRCKLQTDVRIINEILIEEGWREFINGERRLKRKLIKEHEEELLASKEEDQKYSQAFTANKTPRKLPPLNGPKMA